MKLAAANVRRVLALISCCSDHGDGELSGGHCRRASVASAADACALRASALPRRCSSTPLSRCASVLLLGGDALQSEAAAARKTCCCGRRMPRGGCGAPSRRKPADAEHRWAQSSNPPTHPPTRRSLERERKTLSWRSLVGGWGVGGFPLYGPRCGCGSGGDRGHDRGWQGAPPCAGHPTST